MSTAASVLSGLLFVLALIFWLRGLRPGRLKEEAVRPFRQDFRPAEYLPVLALCLGSLVVHAALVGIARLAGGKNTDFLQTFRMYTGLDSNHYLEIAQFGYDIPSELGEFLDLVFFPGYPMLAGMLMMLLPEALSGYIAAWVPFLIGGTVLYRMLRLDYDRRASLRILFWLCLMPGAVFYGYPMSESLFLTAAAGTMLLVRREKWFAAGVCGFLAAFTRSTGILLVIPMGLELLGQFAARETKDVRRLLKDGACILLVPLAICVYLYLNYTVTGNPLIFLQYQKSNWYQQAGWFFETAGTQMEYAVSTWSDNPQKFWGLWMPNLLVGYVSLLLMIFSGRKLRISEGAWFFAWFAMCYGATWLLSGPRYMAVFYPMAILTEELRIPRVCKVLLLGIAAVAYTVFFALRWGVW